MAIAPEAWLGKPVALVALGPEEAQLARCLARHFPLATLHVHVAVPRRAKQERPESPFDEISSRVAALFDRVPGIIALAPMGVVVRSLAPLLRSKLTDPAVVVLDAGARYAVSLLSGHEGGANALSLAVADVLGAEPVITTTTEAVKRTIVGIGCRRGVPSSEVVLAVKAALARCEVELATVRWLVTADIKRHETGLYQAAWQLGLPLRFLPREVLRRWALTESARVQRVFGLPAVAEPAAMLGGTRTRCLLQRTTIRPGITIALAEEGLPWSGSAREVEKTELTAPNEPS